MNLAQIWEASRMKGSQAYPTSLRSVVALTNNKSQFKLPILADQSVINSGFESRLNPSDGFQVTHIGLRWTNATATTIDEGPLFTNENSTEADAAADIGAIYGGGLTFQVNTLVNAEWKTDIFRSVPTSQAGTTVATDGQAAGTTYSIALDGVGPGAGFIAAYPMDIYLDGSKKNEFTLNLASGKADIEPDNDTNYLVLDLRGYYVVNGSSK